MVGTQQPLENFTSVPLREFRDTSSLLEHSQDDYQEQPGHYPLSTCEESSLVKEPMKRARLTAVRTLADQTWTLEALSCSLSAGALVTVIAVLIAYDGQPIPQWPHYITLNSLIAVFTAIFKASMMMPVAEGKVSKMFCNPERVTKEICEVPGISELKWSWFRNPRSLMDLDKMDSASRGPWGALCLLMRMKP